MSVYCVCALSIARTCVATWNCCARACVRMCTTVPSMSNNLMCDVTPRQRGSNAFLSFAPSLSLFIVISVREFNSYQFWFVRGVFSASVSCEADLRCAN